MEMTMLLKSNFCQQAHMVQCTLHHGLRRGCAVFCKDVLFQTAAIHADADGNVLALTGIHHSLHPVIVADVAGV